MGSMAANRVIAISMSAMLFLFSFPSIGANAAEANNVNITVDTGLGRKLISPYIYGINDNADLTGLSVHSIKQGGDKLSTYNWENNYSNLGIDWFNTSDNSLVAGFNFNEQKQPALAVKGLIDKSIEHNIPYTITTLPMCGYVAADGNGPILDDQIAPSARWISIQNRKSAPFTLNPDLTDNTVFVDEYLNYILNKYGKSGTSTGVKAYALDNEPDLWSTTHKVVHPSSTTCDELVDKSIELATTIKGLDEHAMVFGGQLSGMKALISFNDAPDWTSNKETYNWFVDYYLAEMKLASSAQGKRLLDVLDIHYYSEDGVPNVGNVVNIEDYNNIELNKVRMQAARTLWDGTYTENSWIGQFSTQYTPLLPTIQASINKYFSGTKLALSEYNFGGGGDISGGIAQVDALGNFAKEGVYLACLNPKDENFKYQKSAINLFTNYDGNGSSFGNTIVKTETNNIEYSSAYSAIDNANESVLKIILVNKNYDTKQTANISINSSVQYKGGIVYGFNSKSSEIAALHGIKNVIKNTFTYELAPRSVVELILTTDGAAPQITTSDYPYNVSQTFADTNSTEITNPSLSNISNDSNSSDSMTNAQTAKTSNSNISDLKTTATNRTTSDNHSRNMPFFVKFIISIFIILTLVGIGYLFLADVFIKK